MVMRGAVIVEGHAREVTPTGNVGNSLSKFMCVENRRGHAYWVTVEIHAHEVAVEGHGQVETPRESLGIHRRDHAWEESSGMNR